MAARLLALVLLALLPLLGGCGKEPLYQEESFVFGTRVEVSLYGEDEAKARAAVAAVMHEFQRLNGLLHAWQPSPLSELNAALAQGQSHTVSPELADILRDAARLSAQSGGLFHPGIGGLVRLWGFQSDEFKPLRPDGAQIEALVGARPSMADLSFTPAPDGDVTVASRNPALQIDLGGYAKGYALDRAIALLKQQGVRNALVNIGGNVMALGQHGSRPWRVGIQHPRKPGPLATLELRDGEAIGTSGDYQRYFELDGQRYCHLIDPRSGRPAQGAQAVTVLTHGAHAGVLSDVASKAPFMADNANWLAAAAEMGVDEAMRIDAAGVVHLSTALQKRLEFADKSQVRQIESH
jgi:thiamine biosynthesis lipoprotein